MFDQPEVCVICHQPFKGSPVPTPEGPAHINCACTAGDPELSTGPRPARGASQACESQAGCPVDPHRGMLN